MPVTPTQRSLALRVRDSGLFNSLVQSDVVTSGMQTESLAQNKVKLSYFLEELRRARAADNSEEVVKLMNEFTFSDEAATRRTPVDDEER